MSKVPNVYGSVKSNKGFYVGDICYVLGDEIYDGFWGNNYPGPKNDESRDYFDDGVFDNVLGSGFGFAVCTTGVGDGCYPGHDGHDYPVDAGVIGVVPFEIIEKYGRKDALNEDGTVALSGHLGRYIPVNGPSNARFETEPLNYGTIYAITIVGEGVHEFISIETDPDVEDMDDDDYYDDEDDDEGEDDEEE